MSIDGVLKEGFVTTSIDAVINDVGLPGFLSMMLFLAILVVGFVYEWMKGALEWE